MKRLCKALGIILIVLAVCGVGVGVYAGDYYRADEAAVAAMTGTDAVSVIRNEDGIVFLPEGARTGFIFYPGGKVEAAAYAPLMQALAREGVLCVLTEMPLNLAVLDMNAADGVAEKYPQIERWSIGGHSLGGAMAASYAAKHPETVDGLALLAAYSTEKLPEGLDVVSIYGTQDTVLDREKYAKYRENLPAGTVEAILEGGNHAQFGSYGPQKGDGEATMPSHTQLAATLEALLPLFLAE